MIQWTPPGFTWTPQDVETSTAKQWRLEAEEREALRLRQEEICWA